MKKHILLVEKNREGFLDFMKVLQSNQIDYKVTYTACYEHALQMLQYIVPDSIFMRIDGNEEETSKWIKRIREHEALNHVKIVLYDEEVTTNMIRQSIRQGADYCIDRPSTYADISYLLKDVFSHPRSCLDHSSGC